MCNKVEIGVYPFCFSNLVALIQVSMNTNLSYVLYKSQKAHNPS